MKFLFLIFLLLNLSLLQQETKMQEEWDNEQAWNKTFVDHEKVVENFNMMHPQDDLLETLGSRGTEMDHSYPFYFNTKLNKTQKRRALQKMNRLRKERRKQSLSPLPPREECDHKALKRFFKESCRVYLKERRLMLSTQGNLKKTERFFKNKIVSNKKRDLKRNLVKQDLDLRSDLDVKSGAQTKENKDLPPVIEDDLEDQPKAVDSRQLNNKLGTTETQQLDKDV